MCENNYTTFTDWDLFRYPRPIQHPKTNQKPIKVMPPPQLSRRKLVMLITAENNLTKSNPTRDEESQLQKEKGTFNLTRSTFQKLQLMVTMGLFPK
jgi:hypothetical protein